jgi:hypothetical protein
VSARAFAVFFAVLAVIGLLGYGLLNKDAEALEPGEKVPTTVLPKLDEELGTTGVPESFLVGPDGRLVLHRLGPVTTDYLNSNVAPYLTGKAKQ